MLLEERVVWEREVLEKEDWRAGVYIWLSGFGEGV